VGATGRQRDCLSDWLQALYRVALCLLHLQVHR
jgi:hypothetical protein